jgi:UDPglucose 6-dehydrogenase
MRIGFVGLGKLGLPVALAVEQKGHEVMGCDVSADVLTNIRNRHIPYREEGAQAALDRSDLEVGNLPAVVEFSDIIFLAVQTPHHEKYEGITRIPDERVDFDYTWLVQSVKDVSRALDDLGEDRIVIIISTVLPGTIEREVKPYLSPHVKLCYNPFFIAMGTTMHDFVTPEFVLFGVDDPHAAEVAREFYSTIHAAPFYETDIKSAELIKVAYNTFIGLKIVFANTMMEICHHTGADVDSVTEALKLATERIISGNYMGAGMGDGGGCHPRDNIALSWLARELDLSYDLFESVMLARERQTEWLAKLMEGHDLPKVILGRAFKPNTNLTVGSPAVLLKNILVERGHDVTMYDPHVDTEPPEFEPSVFLIGTKHPEWLDFSFPAGSVILDPWRYIPEQEGCTVIPIGQGAP